MLKGDLTTTPIETVLTDLAAEAATGGLHVVDDDGDEALVYFRAGLIYAVSRARTPTAARRPPDLQQRTAPEHLAEALEAQRTELQGWRLGELLVHLGFTRAGRRRSFRPGAGSRRHRRPAATGRRVGGGSARPRRPAKTSPHRRTSRRCSPRLSDRRASWTRHRRVRARAVRRADARRRAAARRTSRSTRTPGRCCARSTASGPSPSWRASAASRFRGRLGRASARRGRPCRRRGRSRIDPRAALAAVPQEVEDEPAEEVSRLSALTAASNQATRLAGRSLDPSRGRVRRADRQLQRRDRDLR